MFLFIYILSSILQYLLQNDLLQTAAIYSYKWEYQDDLG